MLTDSSIVLYGAGSAMVVEVEESCARLGLQIAAIVKNVEGRDMVLARELVVAAGAVGPGLTARPYIVPIFTPGHRLAASREAAHRGFRNPATIVDPTAVVARSARVGAGTYVNSLAAVGGASRIGEFVFINRGASIGHHVEIDDFAAIGPGAIICGEVRLGRGAVIAAGAIVLPAVEVGANCVVAAGAVLRKSIPDHCLAAGDPARIVKRNYPGFRNLSV